MDLSGKIKELALAQLVGTGQFVVDVHVSGISGPQKVTVLLDGDNGVTIDDCATLSRELLEKLEEAEMVGENFTLEVSTPGVDKPLKLKRQFVKNTGRTLKVVLVDKTTLTGKLIEATEDHITLEQEVGEGKKKELKNVSFPFEKIEKAFVQISFK